MPKLLTREPDVARTEHRSPSIAALIASFETSSVQRSANTERDFRELARARRSSIDEAWAPIRTAALVRGAS